MKPTRGNNSPKENSTLATTRRLSSSGPGWFANNGTGIFYQNIGAPMTSTVSHNVINGNTGAGASIVADAGGVVTFHNNNVISGNGQYGIFVSQLTFGLRVTNNTSLANGAYLSGAWPNCGSRKIRFG
jgi:hypothetical protein